MQINYEINQFLFENVSEYSSVNQRDLTYIGIGTSPRYPELEKFTPEIDQLLPTFMLKEIESTNKTIRIIHIDCYTEQFIPFLHEYFTSYAKKGLNFRHTDSEGMNIWTSDDERIEIIFMFINIRHGNIDEPVDRWFLEKMIDITIRNKTQLIIMEYTGHDLIDIAKFFFKNSNNKEMFLKHILFDVTYGTTECYCLLDMSKYFPMYKSDGTFYNFRLYNNQEMQDLIGIDDKINDIIKNHFMKDYKFILDKHHLNYRRKIIGTDLAYQFPEYNESTSVDEIMKIIIDKLNVIITIFDLLGLINHEKKEKINNLFTNYYSYDMYKWSYEMNHMYD